MPIVLRDLLEECVEDGVLAFEDLEEVLARVKQQPGEFFFSIALLGLERELVKLKLLVYLSERIGDQMDAVVTGVESFGLFCQGLVKSTVTPSAA